jgi:5'-methylthioadenosine phosphorylase
LKKKLGIIGGSGLYDLDESIKPIWETIDTPWGKPSDQVLTLKFMTHDICFIPRHGRNHTISPSNINYRANIDALKQKGVTDIISISAVGSLKEELSPGYFVLVDQFIDMTTHRKKTFYDEEVIAHVSMAHPTSIDLIELCCKSLKKQNIKYKKGATYVAIEGPHFSSKAESNLYKSWGADIIGMTNMPEAKLAKEAEMRYCTVGMVTDYDSWRFKDDHIDIDSILKTLSGNTILAKKMVKDIIDNLDLSVNGNDDTHRCLDTAIITPRDKMTEKTMNKLKTVAGRVLFNKNLD